MKLIERILPPIVYDALYYSPLKKYGWFGDYATWEEAEKASIGYNADLILEKVKAATLKVHNGLALYERDSKLFNRIHYDWPVLAALLWVAAQNKGELNVIDFGGSLGSTFRQNKKFFASINVRWNVIEQPQFIAWGKNNLQDEHLRFYGDITVCLEENSPQVILLSSVLPYIKEPYALLSDLATQKIQYLIIEKMPLINAATDRLTVQRVHPEIYDASYPAWFFSKSKFMNFINQNFDLVEDYQNDLRLNVKCEMKGFILKVKQ